MWTVEPITGLMIAVISVAIAVIAAPAIADRIIQFQDRRHRGSDRHTPTK
jgi:hypothetical protein